MDVGHEGLIFASMLDVSTFIQNESKLPNPRLALISCILGELEENLNFPLSTFKPAYSKFLQFVEEMKSCLSATKPETLKKMAQAAWNGKKTFTKKRTYDQKHAQLWHFVNTQKLNCIGFATVVVASCLLLGVKNVHTITSEVHVWLGFFDDTETLINSPSHIDLLQGMCEIMTPSSQPGDPVKLENSHCWGYQRNNQSEWLAPVWDHSSYIGLLIQNAVIDEGPKVQLIRSTFDACHIYRVPSALTELGRCYNESNEIKNAEKTFLEAISSSKKFFKNCNTYPHTELASFYLEHGHLLQAFNTAAEGLKVACTFKYTSWDTEIRVDITNLVKDLITDLVKQKEKGNDFFWIFIEFFDYLFLWFEKSNFLFPMDWQSNLKKALPVFDLQNLPLVAQPKETEELKQIITENKQIPTEVLVSSVLVEELMVVSDVVSATKKTHRDGDVDDRPTKKPKIEQTNNLFQPQSLSMTLVLKTLQGNKSLTTVKLKKLIDQDFDQVRAKIWNK